MLAESPRLRSLPRLATALLLAAALPGFAHAGETPPSAPPAVIPNQTPLDLVNALHGVFGEHHERAVHTKGVMFEGTFTPAADAQTITKSLLFTAGTLPVTARFSLFSGIPDVPDTDRGAASPTGFALKVRTSGGETYDLVGNQHNGFIVATADEFAAFLRAVAASGSGVPHPTPVEQFLATRPISQQFLATLTAPASYATATFYGVNSFKLTNAQGRSVYARYRYVPRAGERYLTPAELASQGPSYLQEEIVERVAREPVVFDWYAQIAESGDAIEDPSIAWPESRKLVKLGTFTLTRRPADPEAADRSTLFLPGQTHPGIEPADPMLLLRTAAYPISFGQRQ